MDWDICHVTGIIKIIPAIIWHKGKHLIEFGWITWSFVIRLK